MEICKSATHLNFLTVATELVRLHTPNHGRMLHRVNGQRRSTPGVVGQGQPIQTKQREIGRLAKGTAGETKSG